MKAIMVMFDTLNRRMLPPYGCDWVHAPNFARLAECTAVFDNAYVGSMPCMPARRELHTGRYNFLHRSWGPIEPFDDSMPELLKQHGIHTHLASDHYHYWEEGGANYHTRYSTWEIARGHEGEPWKGDLRPVEIPPNVTGRADPWFRQDVVNRQYMPREEDQPQANTFRMGLDFMRTNAGEDNWFLQIETFDPHEPFFTQAHYKALYPHEYHGRQFDWPPYERVCQTPEEVEHCRMEYAALVSMCDHSLGQVLDAMDELNLWDDTLLIVNTDHGFLLGEHDWWAKCVQPFYDEVAHTPLFIWDPRCRAAGVRRSALVQTIDLAPTLLEYFGVARPAAMQGRPLRETLAADAPVREAALFGLFGSQVNVTDSRYVYMRGPASPENRPLYEYTLMPTHMRRTFGVDELQDITLAEPFPFTKGCRTLRIAGRPWAVDRDVLKTMLFDLQTDPGQLQPLQDAAVEQRMIRLLVRLMAENDAPAEQYARLGLPMEEP
jgi:arylsulfatase A-like enzyme